MGSAEARLSRDAPGRSIDTIVPFFSSGTMTLL